MYKRRHKAKLNFARDIKGGEVMGRKAEDLAGKRFGMLTVIKTESLF